MAEKKVTAPERFIGASGDAKSTDGATSVRPGATWFEYDTGDMYTTYDGTNWVVKKPTPGRLKTVTGSSSANSLAAYAANDVISNSTASGTTFAFPAIARANGQGGYLTQANINIGTSGVTSTRLTMFLFNTAPGSGLNDNAANILVGTAEASTYMGKIDWVALEVLGSGRSQAVATPNTLGNIPVAFTCASGADDLYGVLVTRDSTTIGTNVSVRVDLTAEQY